MSLWNTMDQAQELYIAYLHYTVELQNGGLSVIVFESEVRDEFLSSKVPQRVLQLHQLDEQVIFRVEARRCHGALEVEAQPLLYPFHAASLCEIHEQRNVKHDWSGKNGIPAKEVNLDLHRIAEPTKDVYVVPALFVIAPRRIVVDPDLVSDVSVQFRIQFGLEYVL